MNQEFWITHLEAARILGVNPGTVQKMLARGDLERRPPPRNHGTPSISAESVEHLRLVREQRAAERAEADERRRAAGTPPNDGQDWLSARETAELLGLSVKWVHKHARAERIPARRHGGRWWVRRADADRLLASRSAGAAREDAFPEWRQVSMRGSDAPKAERGMARSAEITYETAAGRTETFGLLRPKQTDAESGQAVLVAAIEAGQAEACPICRSAAPVLNDHVPPEHFGGSKMINTCDPCNNGLGSRAEAAMREWFDQTSRVRITVPDRQEPIAVGWAMPRTTADGKPLIILESRGSPADEPDVFAEHMRAGVTGTFSVVEPRHAEYMNGFLKQAFLTAVLFLRGVPNCDSAAEIQAELVAARDAPSRSAVQLGQHAAAMQVYRTGLPRNGPALALLRAEIGDRSFPVLSLAGTLIVDWPFPEIDPFSW